MRVLTLDYETYYSREYSLRKMSPAEYILDPQFQCTGLAVKRGDAPAEWVHGEDVEEFFCNEPTDVMCISHNALFDMSICAWRYGWVPKLMVDTLGIARAILAKELKYLSLDKVGEHLKLGRKTGALAAVIGMRREDIQARPDLYASFQDYGKNDVDICYGIFQKLVLTGEFPMQELVVMDMVLRCAVQPQFIVDVDLLRQRLVEIRKEKEETLSKAMLAGADGKTALMSNQQFAELLRTHGVEPPMKTSPLTGKTTFAFAKTDQAFNDLLEHPNPAVQALVAARLDHKSTIEETRHERFINIASLEWPEVSGPTPVTSQGYRRLMPMPLKYSGAHTHRLCLVGSTEITVLRNKRVVCIKLQELEDADLVWDGSEFVSHGGLSFAGVKKVITYDGITGTPDHRVWTVQRGYCSLAEAKARGYDIARGATPDAARIEASVFRSGEILDADKIHLLEVRSADGVEMGGHTSTEENLVPVVPQEGVYEGEGTFQGNAAASLRGKPEGRSRAPQEVDESATAANRGMVREIAVQVLRQKVGKGLEGCDGYGIKSEAAVHQPEYIELHVLRRQGDQVQFPIHSTDGKLDTREPWPTEAGYVYRQDRSERTLRTGEPALGIKGRTSTEPEQYAPVWDIVDCGPRNRFMANGRIVHNSGDWKMNAQNLGRGSALRKALCAPEGYVVVAGDESQVEARITCTLAGQEDMRQQFENGEDVYCFFATDLFGRTITKADKVERWIGKTAVLGLGFGLGKDKFTESIPVLAWNQMGIQLPYTPEEGAAAVGLYRSKNFHIANAWKLLGANGIRALIGGGDWQWGPVLFRKEEIVLPNGMKLYYHNLRQEQTETGHEWVFDYGGTKKRIYGGKLLENIVQALARIIVMDAAVQVQKHLLKLGIRLALQVHDELVFVVKQEHEKVTRFVLEHELKRRPKWLPNLPLDCEIASGPTYGDAK